MEIDMRTEREYIEKRRLTTIDEKGIKYWACKEVGELIRCKDCEYCKKGVCWNIRGLYSVVSDMEYCSRGERRGGDE